MRGSNPSDFFRSICFAAQPVKNWQTGKPLIDCQINGLTNTPQILIDIGIGKTQNLDPRIFQISGPMGGLQLYPVDQNAESHPIPVPKALLHSRNLQYRGPIRIAAETEQDNGADIDTKRVFSSLAAFFRNS